MTDERPHIAIFGGTREMNDEEYAEYQEKQPERENQHLQWNRLQVQNNILQLLKNSDGWAARAFEEGTTINPARKTYRQTLRKLLVEVEKSDDPLNIEIPEVPPYS